MKPQKKVHPAEKENLHPRNRHRERYDLKTLAVTCPQLAPFVRVNEWGDESVDFFNPQAVKMLNKALLMHFYGVQHWDIPDGYLCPPIPGRADYLHYVAELLGNCNNDVIPTGKNVRCLDIGAGANCVYPLIGQHEYGWSFVGSETDAMAITAARQMLEKNPGLNDKIEMREQVNPRSVFHRIIQPGEKFDLVVCNPPFYASAEEAQAGSARKVTNLSGKKIARPVRNFGGINRELWCEGGEAQFVQTMVHESKMYADRCFMYSALLSKNETVPQVYDALEKAGAFDVATIPMGQGNKTSRIVVWTFLDEAAQEAWGKTHWV